MRGKLFTRYMFAEKLPELYILIHQKEHFGFKNQPLLTSWRLSMFAKLLGHFHASSYVNRKPIQNVISWSFLHNNK